MSNQPLPKYLRTYIRELQQRQNREKEQRLLIEGPLLIEEALTAGLTPEFAVVSGPDISRFDRLAESLLAAGVMLYHTPPRFFERLGDTKTPQGILAVIPYPDLPFNPSLPIVALDGISDPGNAGTIVRTAAWFGLTNIIFGPGSADRFHPKTLRATMGAAFHCFVAVSDDLPEYLRRLAPDHTLYGATLSAKIHLDTMRPSGKFGIVFGSEALGISSTMLKSITECYTISGSGPAESLNVAVAAGISLYHFAQFV